VHVINHRLNKNKDIPSARTFDTIR